MAISEASHTLMTKGDRQVCDSHLVSLETDWPVRSNGHQRRSPIPAVVVASFPDEKTAWVPVPARPVRVASECGDFELPTAPEGGTEYDVEGVSLLFELLRHRDTEGRLSVL